MRLYRGCSEDRGRGSSVCGEWRVRGCIAEARSRAHDACARQRSGDSEHVPPLYRNIWTKSKREDEEVTAAAREDFRDRGDNGCVWAEATPLLGAKCLS